MVSPQNFTLEPNLRPLLKDLGIQPVDVCRRAGLPEDLITHLPTHSTPEQFFALWEAIEAEVGDAAFAIQLTEAVTAESLSPPVFGALCSPNPRAASERLRDDKRRCSPLVLDVVSGAQGLDITFKWPATPTRLPCSMTALELVFFTRLARMATREHVVPVRVTSPNPPEPAAACTEFLGVPIEKGRHSILFSREDAERPFLTANEAMWSAFEPELRRRLSALERNATIAERVKAVLLESLPSGQTYRATTDAKCGPAVIGMTPDRAFDSLIPRTIRGALKP